MVLMIANKLPLAAPLLAALALAGCTTSGTGVGTTTSGAAAATFTWSADSSRHGTMTAVLSAGGTYTGEFFQITSDTTVNSLGPMWVGWGGRRGWGGGWGGWGGWGPSDSFVTEYSGKVVANLQGPSGFMRCRFDLIRPSSGMSGGGQGRCQLPDSKIIEAQFSGS